MRLRCYRNFRLPRCWRNTEIWRQASQVRTDEEATTSLKLVQGLRKNPTHVILMGSSKSSPPFIRRSLLSKKEIALFAPNLLRRMMNNTNNKKNNNIDNLTSANWVPGFNLQLVKTALSDIFNGTIKLSDNSDCSKTRYASKKEKKIKARC